MSVALVKEVFNHAPAELTPLERLVLLAIAEKAQDGDREDVEARVSYPSMEVLAHWTGKSPGAVRAALRRLEGRGYKVRVPCGTDHTGRPVYAYPGRATRYRVPQFPKRKPPGKGVTAVTPSATERRHPGDAIAAERGHHGDAIAAEWRHGDDPMASPDARDGVTGVTPNQKEPEGTTPQPPASPSPPASARSGDGRGDDPQPQDVARAPRADAYDTTDDPRRPAVEAALRALGTAEALIVDVATLAMNDPGTRSPEGRLRASIQWRRELETEVRRTRQREAERTMSELTAQDQPPCPHGKPGGTHALPVTGGPICPLCRVESRQPRVVAS